MKPSKKNLKDLRARRAQAMAMLDYALTQVEKAKGEGKAAQDKAEKYLQGLNDIIAECNRGLGDN